MAQNMYFGGKKCNIHLRQRIFQMPPEIISDAAQLSDMIRSHDAENMAAVSKVAATSTRPSRNFGDSTAMRAALLRRSGVQAVRQSCDENW